MFFYEKKMIYLSAYQGTDRLSGAGFGKMTIQRLAAQDSIQLKLELKVRNLYAETEGIYPVLLQLEAHTVSLGRIRLQKGTGSFSIERQMEKMETAQLQGVSIPLDGAEAIQGFCDLPGSAQKASIIKKTSDSDLQAADLLPPFKTELLELKRNKWEQLQKNYEVIHPYGDDRSYISISPKDFVIMPGQYQPLANNSFLLHGYYHYRHVILGPEKENEYYLGVPGVYYEREKMVAFMFGFEAFECEGQPIDGKFGYYLKKIKI